MALFSMQRTCRQTRTTRYYAQVGQPYHRPQGLKIHLGEEDAPSRIVADAQSFGVLERPLPNQSLLLDLKIALPRCRLSVRIPPAFDDVSWELRHT
ncbi:hypothetical protein FA95DRAFT_1003677 [Auriscalpium vulgare]|uniref:Uncharacterized protein n=1 Tax=Auriscalpium vulgare TaxID=40419 RepID=A0ACB8R645_9AGAM|nr:hypothetical protein FA95DRAFT_1003677 [Auriscalpium vulgare]